MDSITVDQDYQVKWRGIVQPVEIRDLSGAVLGHYTPLLSPEEATVYARARELFDLDEAKRRLSEERGRGVGIDQVRAHLKSLEQPG